MEDGQGAGPAPGTTGSKTTESRPIIQMRRRPVPVWVVRDQSDQSIASIASWTISWRFVGHGLKIQLFQGKMTRSIGAIGAWSEASDPCHWKEDSGTGAPQLDMGGGSSGDGLFGGPHQRLERIDLLGQNSTVKTLASQVLWTL